MQPVPVPETLRAQFAEGSRPGSPGSARRTEFSCSFSGSVGGRSDWSLNGDPVHDVRNALHRIARLSVGDSVSLVVIRGGARSEVDLNCGGSWLTIANTKHKAEPIASGTSTRPVAGTAMCRFDVALELLRRSSRCARRGFAAHRNFRQLCSFVRKATIPMLL